MSAKISDLPAHWRNSAWSARFLAVTFGLFFIALAFFTVLVALLPDQTTPVGISPQFADARAGNLRLPLNLPEPAAGGAALKIPLTVPTFDKPDDSASQQPALTGASPPSSPPGYDEQERPAKAETETRDRTAIAKVAVPTLPRSRTPRRPLAKYAEISGDLTLPRVASDGTAPLDYYKSPALADADDDKARIALIITGFGLNSARSQAALESLPATITIAVSPYAQDPQRWVNTALDQGREALMMVPMEPNSFPSVDPGPDTLMRDAPTIQTLERLHSVLAKAQGYVGIVNDTGSRFTANAIALAPVLDDISQRGIMVVDARASAYSVLASEAAKRDIPVAINTRFIDTSLTPADIQRQLRDLERTAQTLGVGVGLLRTLPVSIAQVIEWQNSLDRTEFVLAPISSVANQQPVR